jgi:hypothetical protein
LINIGLTGIVKIDNSSLPEIFLPAIIAVPLGSIILLNDRCTLSKLPRIKVPDYVSTLGLAGAMSGSTPTKGSGATRYTEIAADGERAPNARSTGEPSIFDSLSNASIKILTGTLEATDKSSNQIEEKHFVTHKHWLHIPSESTATP